MAFCSKCGLPVSNFFPDTNPHAQPQPPQNMNGGYYGTPQPTNPIYLSKAPQNPDKGYMPYQNYGQGMPPKKNNTLMIVLIILVTALVIVGAVIAILLINQGSSGGQEQSSAVSETTGSLPTEQASADLSSVPYSQPSVYTPSITYSEPSVYTPSTTYSEPSVYTPSMISSEPSVYTPSTTYSEPSADVPSEISSEPSDVSDASSIDIDKYLPYMKQKSQWSYFNDSRYADPNYKIPTPESCITTIKKTVSDFDTSNEYGLYYTYESEETEDVIAYIVLMKALGYDIQKYENPDNPDQSFFYFAMDDHIVLSFTIRTINAQDEVGMMIVRGDYE